MFVGPNPEQWERRGNAPVSKPPTRRAMGFVIVVGVIEGTLHDFADDDDDALRSRQKQHLCSASRSFTPSLLHILLIAQPTRANVMGFLRQSNCHNLRHF